MSNKRFNWGIIGPGRISRDFANGFSAVTEAELYAVASRDKHRGQQFADEFGIAKVFSSYSEMVDDPRVDAIYIGTPHRFHYDLTKLCLQAGKPVLCEKPLTVNAAECLELIDLSQQNKVFLMEAVWSRYLPVYQQVREWLDENKIGEVRLIHSTFSGNVPRDADDRWFNAELAGGALLDMGIYNVNLSQWVYGKNPESLVAQGHVGETNVDEMTSVVMHYGQGRMSQFTTGLIAEGSNDFSIFGSQGRIRVHPHLCNSTKATLFDGKEEHTVTRPLRANGYEYEIEEATRCIRAGFLESPTMTHAETLANMRVMDDIRQQIGLQYPFE